MTLDEAKALLEQYDEAKRLVKAERREQERAWSKAECEGEEAMKKRLEAWANEYHDGVDLCERLLDAEREAKNFGGALRVAIRLVECGPDEVVVPKAAAAVVRAAIAVVEGYSEKRLGKPARYAELKRAVARMQKGRK